MLVKNKLRYIILLVVTTLIIGIVTSTMPINVSAEVNEVQIIYNQYEGSKQNNKILNYFESANTIKTISNIEEQKLNYPDYYGGSYLDDNGELVVLIKNTSNSISKMSLLKDVSDNKNLKFETANYSYSELYQMIQDIMSYKQQHEGESLADDIISCALNDKENYIEVNILNSSNEKIKSFKESVLNSDALMFKNTDDVPTFTSEKYTNTEFNAEIINDSTNSTSDSFTFYPGMGILTNGHRYSSGFRLYRDITSGRQYGFVSCAHNMAVGEAVHYMDLDRGYFKDNIGKVQLLRFGGQYDVTFISFNSETDSSSMIYDTIYSLVTSNEEIEHPVYGKYVYLDSNYNKSKGGKITSTSVSGYIKNPDTNESTYLEDLMSISASVQSGDSGGLVSSNLFPTILNRVQEGIIISTDGSDSSLALSAAKIVNLWYLTCY